MKQTEVLVLIPARGNSKSIPKKNIRDFAGYPLIAYSIIAALRSEYVSRVIVSTDNSLIAEVAREFGAETPFSRPAELAQDDTLDYPVFKHALEWLVEHENYRPRFIVHLRPTSPVMPERLIDEAVACLINHPEADSVRVVVPSGQNPYKMWQIAQGGMLEPLISIEGLSETYNAPRQELPQTYWQTGHLDAIRRETIIEKRSMNGDKIFPVIIDPAYAVDIDTPLDWKRAERLVKEGTLDMIYPGLRPRPLPEKLKLLVLDFDGVLTDDRVWVDQNGKETVAASRSDGLGLELLRKRTDIEVFVMSKETNPVVSARCKKLQIPVYQSVERKEVALKNLIAKKKIKSEEVLYVGNDVNDLPCFPMVGYAVVPGNAFSVAKRNADLILNQSGGFGAVREVCELLIENYAKG